MPAEVVTTLAIPSSPSFRKKKGSITLDIDGIYVPIELNNGCTEDECEVESDDPKLTNAIRRHYLEHFGHRDLEAMVSGYATEGAFLVEVVNGQRHKYHGRDEIRSALQAVFENHPASESTFELKSIIVEAKHATVTWTAKTPTMKYLDSTDAYVFNDEGKIVKQYHTCTTEKIEVPWFVDKDGHKVGWRASASEN